VGAVACSAALLFTVGCSDTVSVNAPPLSGPDARACRALLRALPASVDDQARRPVADENGFAAAWGSPPILLRCGVPRPAGFDKFATCQVVNGVGWFIPESQSQGDSVDITMTTVGRSQNVEVALPSDYFPPANAMVDLAPALKRTIRETRPCV
jgi:Protein of unknown function (DUF3515)